MNSHIYVTMGKHQAASIKSDATAWEQQPKVQKPAHNATPQQPWKTQLHQHLTRTLSFTGSRHVPSSRKPAFSRDTRGKDVDQACADTLFATRGGIQEQIHLWPQWWCQSTDPSSATFWTQASISINLSLQHQQKVWSCSAFLNLPFTHLLPVLQSGFEPPSKDQLQAVTHLVADLKVVQGLQTRPVLINSVMFHFSHQCSQYSQEFT